MLLDQESGNVPRDAHLTRWFVAAGAFGVAVAILLAVGLRFDLVPSSLVVTLWPAAMVQLIDPRSIDSKIAVALISYGSNFLIYGFVGVVVGAISARLPRLWGHRS